MPEMQYFNVTQEREVSVVANSAVDACRIADAAFTHGQNSDEGVSKGKAPEGVWGNTRGPIKVTSLWARTE